MLFFGLIIATLAGLVWSLLWELRNGRTLPFPFVLIPAERVRRPWLYWSQTAGHAFVIGLVVYFAGAMAVALVGLWISN